MDHLRIIRRAFDITRVYRALWVFGILIALATSRGGGGNGGGGQMRGDSEAWNDLFRGRFPNMPQIPPDVANAMIAGGIALLCVALLIGVALAVLRYVSLTAAIRMVDSYESTGERVTVRQGFRLGWTRSAFRLWLVDLLFTLVGILVVILLLLLAAAPLLLWLTQNETVGVIGTVVTIGAAFLVILLLVIAAALIGLWLQVVYRAVVLEGLGVFDGIRRGWEIVRRRPGDVLIMGLILFGIGLAFTILMLPFGLLLAVVAGVTGGLPGLLAGAIASIFAQGQVPIFIGVLIGLPIFLAVLIIPLTFISGLFEVFTSSTWTLTFRELLALETVRSEPEAV